MPCCPWALGLGFRALSLRFRFHDFMVQFLFPRSLASAVHEQAVSVEGLTFMACFLLMQNVAPPPVVPVERLGIYLIMLSVLFVKTPASVCLVKPNQVCSLSEVAFGLIAHWG